MSHRERGCSERTHEEPEGRDGEEKGEEREEGKERKENGRREMKSGREGQEGGNRGMKRGREGRWRGSCTPACDPKTLAMRSSVKRKCRILLEKSASTDFFLPGIEWRMNNTNTSTTRWSADSDTCSIAWRRREEETGGGEGRRRRWGEEEEMGGGGEAVNQLINHAVTPHLDPALGHSFLEADGGADSVKYHKLVRGF